MKNRLALVLQRLLLRTDGLGAQAQAQWTLMSFALRVERERGIAAASAPPTPAIARLVDGNAINPGLQVSVAAKAINALEDAQESLLRQVARFLGIFRQPIEQGENIARTLFDEPVEGRRLARSQSFNELRFDCGARVSRGCRSNLLQLLPPEGEWLSVAHLSVPPTVAGSSLQEHCRFPDSRIVRQRFDELCSNIFPPRAKNPSFHTDKPKRIQRLSCPPLGRITALMSLRAPLS